MVMSKPTVEKGLKHLAQTMVEADNSIKRDAYSLAESAIRELDTRITKVSVKVDESAATVLVRSRVSVWLNRSTRAELEATIHDYFFVGYQLRFAWVHGSPTGVSTKEQSAKGAITVTPTKEQSARGFITGTTINPPKYVMSHMRTLWRRGSPNLVRLYNFGKPEKADYSHADVPTSVYLRENLASYGEDLITLVCRETLNFPLCHDHAEPVAMGITLDYWQDVYLGVVAARFECPTCKQSQKNRYGKVVRSGIECCRHGVPMVDPCPRCADLMVLHRNMLSKDPSWNVEEPHHVGA
jgi:hypothetical protein